MQFVRCYDFDDKRIIGRMHYEFVRRSRGHMQHKSHLERVID